MKPPSGRKAGSPIAGVGITSPTEIIGDAGSRSDVRFAAPIRLPRRSGFAPFGFASAFADLTSHDQIDDRESATLDDATPFCSGSAIVLRNDGGGWYSVGESTFSLASTPRAPARRAACSRSEERRVGKEGGSRRVQGR